MANARKRISELPPLNVASLDTTFVLGISGSTTYKISINNLTSSLDGAFATDLVTNTLSTSLDSKLSTASFQSFSSSVHQRILDATNEQSFNGLISGSSQLTSSYDARYVISGSITQTTWDNIANKPTGIVSQSTDLSSLNTFTASISTASLVNRLNAIENVSGSWITESETGSFLTNLNGAISGAAQISDLGFVTGSYAYLTEFNSLTQSFNIISGSVVNITNAVDVTQLNNTTASLNSFTQSANTSISNLNNATSSYEIKGSGIISGSSQLNGATITNLTITNLTTVNQTASVLYTSGSTTHGNTDNDTHSFTGSVRISGSVVITGSISATSFNGTINSTNSVVSGSSQLSGTTIQNLSGSFTGSFRGNITGTAAYSDLVKTLNSNTNQDYSLIFTTSGSNGYMQTYTDGVPGVLYNPSTNRLKSAYLQGTIEANNGVISGSSQLTSSFDERYTLSGSVQPLPSNLVSSSAQITAFGFVSSSTTIPAGTISGSSQLTSSYDSRYSLSGSILTSFSSSVDNRLDTLEASIITGTMNYTQVLGNRRTGITSVGTSMVSGSITTTGNPVQIMVTGDANPIGGAGWCRLQIFRDGNGIGNIIQVENSSNLNVPYCLNVIDTPSAGTYTYSMRTVDSMSGTFDFGEFSGPLLTAVELKSNTQLPSGLISGSSQLPIGIISGSSQLTSSYDTRYTLSGSVQPLPSGLISGSSQLTASYDTRYTLSGSVVSGTTPAGTISGSSQLTSSFDSRYVLETETGSLQTSITSLNTLTSSLATTGSNSFNGNQTITGSLNVSSIAVVSSSFTANSSSLTLNSGSNLYVQNNGLVEITGSLVVSGSTISLKTTVLQVGTASGDEGGEILLVKSQTNNSLTGSGVTIDSFQNKLRIFEQGGNARGVHIDLTKAPDGVNGELIWKASGIVNAGTFVTLDNIKATLTSSSNRGLSVAAVSTNFSANISAYHAYSGGIAGISANNQSITTTPTTSLFGWNFPAEADGSYYNILDKTNNRFYRITLMIGATFNNNFISIERLY